MDALRPRQVASRQDKEVPAGMHCCHGLCRNAASLVPRQGVMPEQDGQRRDHACRRQMLQQPCHVGLPPVVRKQDQRKGRQ